VNILHVVDQISQMVAGGSAKVPYQLGEAQARMGHKVAIYASDYRAENQKPPEGVTLKMFHCALNLLGGIRLTPSMVFANFKQFDIIHLHNYRTAVNIIAANKGVPYVLQAHGSCLPLRARLSRPVHNFLWPHLILKGAGAYIADAEMEIGQYVAEGADRSKVSLIPVGIDFKEFANAPAQNRSSKKTVLFLGRLHNNKGPDLFLKAAREIGSDYIDFKIAGYNDGCEAEILQQINELGIGDRVTYAGPLYGRDKVKAYAWADVYVMPSRYELFGLTLLEALACGTPVIITDRCGVAPLLPPECGMVVPFDEFELAEVILYTLRTNKAGSYREYRKQWARQYDWANIAPKVIEVYEKVLA